MHLNPPNPHESTMASLSVHLAMMLATADMSCLTAGGTSAAAAAGGLGRPKMSRFSMGIFIQNVKMVFSVTPNGPNVGL